MSNNEEVELLAIHSNTEVEQIFDYSAGPYLSRFLVEMRDNKKIVGVRCPKCKNVFAPPKEVCDACFVVMTEPVEVGPGGVIRNHTTLRAAFVDPETGVEKPVPYVFGNVQLDGSDSLLQNYIVADDESKIKVGARVEIQFHDKRIGSMRDIKCFKVVE